MIPNLSEDLIEPTYLPFTPSELRPHFLADAERHLAYFQDSARRYLEFVSSRSDLAGIPISEAQMPRQIEKDERFWTATSLKRLLESPRRTDALISLLVEAFGESPPFDGLRTWKACVSGELRLVLEAALPSPETYVSWLRDNLGSRHLIPYVLDAAKRESLRTLEGATHVDAIIVNVDNGFSILVEAKVLSDISYHVTFDIFRNQLARNIDVLLESPAALVPPLVSRRPEYSLFVLLSPECFKSQPTARLYGWLFEDYRFSAFALARDLPHRLGVDWEGVSKRIGWTTFERIQAEVPEACPWLRAP